MDMVHYFHFQCDGKMDKQIIINNLKNRWMDK